jgi:multidrug resistance protein, MATE family
MTTFSPDTESSWAGLREVLGMAFPIILGMLSFVFMQFIDQWMVSKLGKEALAAVGSAGLWSYAVTTFFLGIVSCVSTFAAQSLGRGKRENCSAYTWQGIHLALISGVCILALWPAAPWFFGSMGHSPEVTRLEILYFQVRLFGFIFIIWQGALAGFFQAVNRAIVPMYAAVIANVINVILDYLLIFGNLGFPQWGIAGAAVATVASLLVQVIVLQGVFLSPRYHERYRSRAAFRLDTGKLRELLSIGFPAGITHFTDILVWGLFTSYLVGSFGDNQLAAHNTAIIYLHLCFMPALGVHYAIAPIVGQWLGRGRVDLAVKRTYTALKIAICWTTLVGLQLAIFGKPLMRLFSDVPDIIALGQTLLILSAVFQAFDGCNIIVSGALRGAGDTRWLAVTMFCLAYVFFMPLAYVLAVPLDGQATGAWIGATIYIIVLSFFLFWRFRSEHWRNINIFTHESAPAAEAALLPAAADAPCAMNQEREILSEK